MSDLTIHRGATEQIQTIVTPVSLVTGSTIFFMAKRRKTDADADAVLSYSLGAGITVEDAVTGEIITQIEPADTRALTNVSQTLFYEIEIEKAGAIYHVEEGTLTVEPEVVQRALP